MAVVTKRLKFKTKANGSMFDITPLIEEELSKIKLSSGIVTLFCVGSTSSISTIEFEPGLQKDMPKIMEKIAPKDGKYDHENTWHDDNGHSHVRATLMGPSITVPFVDKKLTLGTWQQVAFFEWDTSDRSREVVCQFIGE